MSCLGTRVTRQRVHKDRQPTELAKELGISRSTLWRIESGGIKNVSGETVARLARSLGTSTDYLLGLTDEPNLAQAIGEAVYQRIANEILTTTCATHDPSKVFMDLLGKSRGSHSTM